MPSTHSEQRRFPRFSVHKALNVIDIHTSKTLGRLVNVSQEGLMLLGTEPLQDGGVFQTDLLVSHGDEISDRIHMGIECLWANAADTDDKVWSGFRIIDISDTDSILLSALIDQLSGGA